MRGRLLAAIGVTVAAVACTEVSTDPNAVAAIQFDGTGYPSVVAGDSLRDSLGTLLPLAAIALNNDGDPIEGAEILYSSPDTIVRMEGNGIVFARGLNPGGAAVRIFATVGSLQSQSVSLLTTTRADSIARTAEADTSTGQLSDTLEFTVLGDTAAGKPKVAVQGWLVSFQLRYRGALIPTNDTMVAHPALLTTQRKVWSWLDTTDSQGRVQRQVFLRSARQPEDTIFLIATARRRKAGTTPLVTETRLIVRQGSTSNRVP